MMNTDEKSLIWIAFWATTTVAIALYLMWTSAYSAINIWQTTSTFTHGYFVFPVFIFMVWQKRNALALFKSKPEWRLVPIIAALSILWLVAQQAGVQVVEHITLVFILITCIWAIIGNQRAKIISFPLMFLIFLAPVGEELVPALMELTADITVWAISTSGIPVYREGLFFSLPSGDWSVVEACSGIRYLIASVVLGCVYAYWNYSSLRRRLLFIALSAFVPLLANSVRAYIIVMLGHFSGNELATGVDHLVYGWLFFGVVMFALFSLGSLFSENSTPAESPVTPHIQPNDTQNQIEHKTSSSFLLVWLLVVISTAAGPVWSAAINSKGNANEIELPDEFLAKYLPNSKIYSSAGNNDEQWNPIIKGYTYKLESTYSTNDSTNVRALAFIYVNQKQGQEMISSVNKLTRNEGSIWRITGKNSHAVPGQEDQNSTSVEKFELRSRIGNIKLMRWYNINGEITTSPVKAKLIELRNRLLLIANTSIHYMLVTDNDEEADEALNEIFNVIMETRFD